MPYLTNEDTVFVFRYRAFGFQPRTSQSCPPISEGKMPSILAGETPALR